MMMTYRLFSQFAFVVFQSRLLTFFTALHGMQTPSSDENSVCPSACAGTTFFRFVPDHPFDRQADL